jgi:ribonucleoside-diphosphate reductase alpha subunit
MTHNNMQVVKRNGSKEDVSFDKVLNRIKLCANNLDVNPTLIAQRTLSRIYDGVKTSELDELAAQLSISLLTTNADYGTLASRIIISNHHKNTHNSFINVVRELSSQNNPRNGLPLKYLADEHIQICERFATEIDAKIDYDRDFLLDYFGFKTLEKQKYLMRSAEGKALERPQHMWMRVAVALWGELAMISPEEGLARIFETYDLVSQKYFIHATPTNYNAGSPRPQMSSCFVEGTLVHTLNGVKPIETVEIGDEVVTHTGSIKKVSQLHKNSLNNRAIYDIKVAGTPTFSVTGNHRLWSLSDEQEKWGYSPSWNSVEYLRTGDWIALPKKKGGVSSYTIDVKDIFDNIPGDGNNINYRYEYTDDMVIPYSVWERKMPNGKTIMAEKRSNPFKRMWVFDSEMMELMGIWYGDGCIVHEKNSARMMKPRCINIVAYHTNTGLIDFVTSTLYSKLGVHNVSIHKDANNMVCMTVHNQFIAIIFEELFKSGFAGKRLPAFFNRLDYDCIVSLLSGIVSSDGCVSKCGNTTVQLTNPPLTYDIFYLARSVGIPMTHSIMHKGDTKPVGRMNIPTKLIIHKIKKYYNDERINDYINAPHEDWNQVRVINGVTFMRLNGKIPTSKNPEYVYTLGVEDDHSYSVGGIMAENCYLLSMADDSISGIYKTLADCAQISKYAGGIGLHIHNIRAKGSHIAGNGGTSTGIVPMLRNFNATARYVDQGSKRNGSIAIYLEPWHADIEDFLRMKLNTGTEDERARDLFYALWVPDLFMERVEQNGQWTLFCPHEAPGLSDVWGEEFNKLYLKYEAEGKGRKTVDAQKLWFKVLDSQIETGTPYILYKDAANGKSNQQNLGTIKSSNLCTEIIEYSSPDETAVCNLASLALPSYVNQKSRSFDYAKLRQVVKVVTRNLNRVIDINFYPTPETKRSNMRHRPIGIGVQGLADVFALLRAPWESEKAASLNQRIFEHIYYAALEASCELAEKEGTYETYEGSPASQGKLQYDLWDITPMTQEDGSLDWDSLKEKIAKHGLRNSLLVAPMPTASTSQILGFNECIEPVTSNIYTRRTLSGEFIIVNRHLMKDLQVLDLWNDDMKQLIIALNGSIQGIDAIPEAIKNLYKTSWEIKQRVLIDMSAARGAFVCQSQSLNLFVPDPTYSKLTSMHFYSWKKGLKTGIYYLRTRAPVMAQKFTVDPELQKEADRSEQERLEKVYAKEEGCLTCSA